MVKQLGAEGEVDAHFRRLPDANPLDVSDPASIERIGDVEAIVHLAALSSPTANRHDLVTINRINALGTLHMLEAARRCGARFVLASSQRVYRPVGRPLRESDPPDPGEPYGVSKLAAERWTAMYAAQAGLSTVVLRIFTVYGPGQRVLTGQSGVATIFLQAALDGRPIWVDGENQVRDLIYLDDVVTAIIQALARPAAVGGVFNVGSGRPVRLVDLAALVKTVTGSTSEIVIENRGGDGVMVVADVSAAERVLGLAARMPLAEGLAVQAAWLRDG
ncbi:MAG: NAD-dependent epimerase/dehydratase family protein [Dehalococcoidia bacterium]